MTWVLWQRHKTHMSAMGHTERTGKKTSPNTPWQNHKKKFLEESYLSQVHTQQLVPTSDPTRVSEFYSWAKGM